MARADSVDRRETAVTQPRLLHGRSLPPPIPTVPLHGRRSEPHSPYYYAPHAPRHQYLTRPEGFISHPQPVQHVEYLHKVWILDCKSCGTFFTNRAMKCVLLLRQDVHLFSTDALPVGCSVYESSAQAPRVRTCDCLTQSLACHGCGASIGYVIVAPCARCSPSHGPATTQRNTNGHRFVFHATEVSYEERLYVPDDPDVVPDATPFSQGSGQAATQSTPSSAHPHTPNSPWSLQFQQTMPTKLKAGFLVYWHHLKRRGDLRGVIDDERSRASRGYGFSASQNSLVAGR